MAILVKLDQMPDAHDVTCRHSQTIENGHSNFHAPNLSNLRTRSRGIEALPWRAW
jgi:hypothetical protein